MNLNCSKVQASLLSLAVILGATGCSAPPGEDVSAWATDLHSAARLIAGRPRADFLRAGIELRIDPGWKTYWRYAGDSGLPPQFDFAGSENVKSATVLWPTPRRFPDGAGGNSIGYLGGVIFPVHVVAADPAKPVKLRLKMNYGVCEKICVPAEAKTALLLAAGPASQEAALASAEARVPKSVTPGSEGPLAIRAAHLEASQDRGRVTVDVVAPEGLNIDLFAEGPAPDWSLPLPQPVGAPNGTARRFAFDVDGLPPGASIKGARLKLTLVAGDQAIETMVNLD